MVRRLSALFVLYVCAASAQSTNQSPAVAVPTADEAARADIAIMEIVGGSPLSPTEKQQIVTIAAHGLSTDPKGWTSGYQNAKKSLPLLTQGTPWTKEESKEYWRLNFANQLQPNAETQIMERHDPTIAIFLNNKHVTTGLVTEASLNSLAQAVAWANSHAGLPAPPADLIATERRSIRQNWASYSPELQTAYINIGRNYAAAASWMANIDAGKRQNYLRSALDPQAASNIKAASGTGPGALAALTAQQYYNVTQADTRLVEQVAGSPLSDTERRQIAEYTAEGLYTKPELCAKNYPVVQQSLQALTGGDRYVSGKDPIDGTNIYSRVSTKEAWRLAFEQQPDSDIEKQIIERHDPLVAARFGENHVPTDVVTEASLRSISDATIWANSRSGLPAPPSDLIATERRLIKQNWASYSPELQTAYAHIGRDVSASSINMSDIEPAKVKNFIQVSLNSETASKNKVTAGSGPGALPALMVQAYYNYLVKNGRTLGMSTQEEIMWTHLWGNRIHQVQRDTAHTLFGDVPSAN